MQLAKLPISRIAGLTVSEVQSLSVAQISALTSGQLEAMPAGLVAALTPVQIAQVSVTQLGALIGSGSIGFLSDAARQQLVNSGTFQGALDLTGGSFITKKTTITAQRSDANAPKVLAAASLLTEPRPFNAGVFVPVETVQPVLTEGQRTIQLEESK